MTAEPPLDFAERLAARRAAWQAEHPVVAARIQVARRVALWVAIPWAIFAAIVVPGGGAGIVVTAGLLWLMLQAWLLCRSKSLSWATYARTFSLSALLAWPIGLLERSFAAVVAWSPADQAASVVIAAPVEETLKLAPLGLVIWLAANRARRMGVADHLLLGLAGGAGFQLTEDIIRRLLDAAQDPGSPFTQLVVALLDLPEVEADYGPIALLPGGSGVDGATFAGHGVLSALVGAGIGLAIWLAPRVGRRAWLIPGALWALAVADHAIYNYVVTAPARGFDDGGGTVTLPGWLTRLHDLWGGGGEAVPLLVALIAAAVIVDRRTVRAVEDRLPPLPAASETAVLVGAAERGPRVWLAALPWLRERRELAYGLARAGDGPRRRAPDEAALAARAGALRAGLAGAAAALLLAVAVCGAAVALGGEPAFLAGLLEDLGAWWDGLSGIQQLAAVFGLAALLALGGMGFLPALGLISTLSAIAEHGQGLGALIRDPRKAIRDFVKDMTPGEALAFAVGLLLERLLRGAGKRIADRFGPRRMTPDEDLPEPPAARTRRIDAERDDLATRYEDDYRRFMQDPDTGRPRPEEAKTMLHMRERGELPADIERAPAGEGDVFSPSTGEHYDIKRFYDDWPPGAGHAPGAPYTPDRGAFTPDAFERNLAKEIREDIVVINDVRGLSDTTLDAMRAVIRQRGWQDRVIFYDGG